jgi:hypothetical protein
VAIFVSPEFSIGYYRWGSCGTQAS